MLYAIITLIGAVLLAMQVYLLFQLKLTKLRVEDVKQATAESAMGVKADLREDIRASAATLSNLQVRLGEVSKSADHLAVLGKEVQSLKELFRSPKLRGGWGEAVLEEMLKDSLPDKLYQTQYRISEGSVVDAVLQLEDVYLPIDSKFPLPKEQGFQGKELVKQIKKHIDDIAKKYIQPHNGTTDFAVMFVPAEAVYYHFFVSAGEAEETLWEYAAKKKVIAVSPNTLYLYLWLVMRSFRGREIAKQTQKLQQLIEQIDVDIHSLEGEFETSMKHLQHAEKSFTKIFQQLTGFRKILKRHIAGTDQN